MKFLLIHKTIVILIDAVALYWGFRILSADWKKRTNRIFFVLSFLLILWITFTFLSNSAIQSYQALLWRRWSWGAICFFCIFAYFFSIYFPREAKRYPILDIFIIFVWLSFFYLLIFTNFILKGAIIKKWGAEMIFGKGALYFYLGLVPFTLLILFQFGKKYFTVSLEEKRKIKYFLIGVFIFTLSNLVFNIILPIVRKSKEYYQFGDYSAIFLLGFTGYAVAIKELFKLKIVLTELLVTILGVILVMLPFLMGTFQMKIFTTVIFLIFCPVGYLLIRSVYRDVKIKDILEKKVKERTGELEKSKKELEKSKKELEEAKTILEVKVKARTKELEELAQSLEEKVKERTKELQERVDELERFHKLTVGRELKMIELKKEIERLKRELEKREP